MDTKIAYCCLNCTASQNCCGPCNKCPACCKDCGDTSLCRQSAYFYNGIFYKDFIFTAEQFDDTLFYYYDGDLLNKGLYNSYYSTMDNPPCCKEGWRQTYNDRTYFYKDDVQFNCEETKTIQDYEDCDDCPTTTTVPSQCYLGAALYTASDPIPAVQCFPDRPDFLDKTGSVACLNSDDCYTQVCVIDYPGSCDGDPCVPFTPAPCQEVPKKVFSSLFSRIDFFIPLNLYNKEGEEVDPSVIGATYNPCTPITLWDAPACHFFHP